MGVSRIRDARSLIDLGPRIDFWNQREMFSLAEFRTFNHPLQEEGFQYSVL